MAILITSPELKKNPPAGWREEDQKEIEEMRDDIEYFKILYLKYINDKSGELFLDLVESLERKMDDLKRIYRENYESSETNSALVGISW